MKCLVKWSLVLLVNLAFALVAFGQSGSIQGTLVDAQGGAVAGANVKAVDQNKGLVVREAISGPDGLFILQPLLPSVYTVRISSKGMKDLVQSDLSLDQ